MVHLTLSPSQVLNGFHRERLEHAVFKELLRMVPGLEERIQDVAELEIVADSVSVLVTCQLSTPLLTLTITASPGRCLC